MAHFGTVNVIEPLKLNKVLQADITKFDNEYESYRKKMEDINSTRAQREKWHISTIRKCLDASVLHILCLTDEIEGAKSMEEGTNAAVEAQFKKQLEVEPIDLADKIQQTLDTVHYKSNRDDPEGDVVMFVFKVVQSFDDKNASEILKNEEMCKKLLYKLVDKSHPPELQKHVRRARQCWTADQKQSISFSK